MIVELAGVPGSGKSTADALLAGGLRRAGVRVESPTRTITAMRGLLRAAVKAAYAARFAALRPVASLRLLAAVHRSAQRSASDEASVALNALLIASILHRRRGARRRSDRVVLLDQGGVQALVSVMASARAALALHRPCWRPLLLADRCLLLTLDPAEAALRLALRPGRMSRVEALSGREQAAELDRIAGRLAEAAALAASRSAMAVRRLSGAELQALIRDPRTLADREERR